MSNVFVVVQRTLFVNYNCKLSSHWRTTIKTTVCLDQDCNATPLLI